VVERRDVAPEPLVGDVQLVVGAIHDHTDQRAPEVIRPLAEGDAVTRRVTLRITPE
jgi:hypothetical protein